MDLTSLLFPVLILLLFIPIFLSGRKQKRAMAEMQSLQASLEAGDIVMTTSGLRATVVDASYEDTIDLEIADGVITTWVRAAVKERIDLSADDAELTESADAPTVAPGAAPATEDAPPSLTKAAPLEKTGADPDESANGSTARS